MGDPGANGRIGRTSTATVGTTDGGNGAMRMRRLGANGPEI
jgi:hypothetical protein